MRRTLRAATRPVGLSLPILASLLLHGLAGGADVSAARLLDGGATDVSAGRLLDDGPAEVSPARPLDALAGALGADACGHPGVEEIERARQSGELGEEEAILYRFYLATDRSRLPARFREGAPLRCGTGFVFEAYSRVGGLSPAVRNAILEGRHPRRLPDVRETPHFVIHYTMSGPDAVPDLAYVDSVAAACEHGWNAFHSRRPWDPPPGDGAYGGGLDKIDCTIQDEEGLGHAAVIDSVPGGAPYDYTAEFFVDHDIAPACLLQTTVVHEYMHVVQAGYGVVGSASWYLENSAMIAQEWAYDECDDYHGWLPCFFNYPYRRLITHNGCYEYGAIVWPMFQAERFDEDVVRRIWELFRWNGNIYTSHEEALAGYGSTLAGAYLEFIRWCFYTRHRADPRHFEEASQWQTRLFAQKSHDAYPTGEQHPLLPPEGLGTAVLLFRPDPGSADQVIDFTVDGPDCALGVQLIVKWAGEQNYFEYVMGLDSHGDGALSLPGFAAADSVFMLVSMNTTCSGARDFVYTAATRLDPASTGSAAAERIEFFAGSPNPSSGPIHLAWRLPEAGRVTIEILDAGGRRVHDLAPAGGQSGAGDVIWDGRDENGRPLPSGLYLARLRFAGREQVQKLVRLNGGGS